MKSNFGIRFLFQTVSNRSTFSGVLVDFISMPVTVGFTSATSLIVATSQLKGLMGLKFASSGFADNLLKVIQHIGETRTWDLVLGLSCIVTLLSLRVRLYFLHRQRLCLGLQSVN